MQIEKWFNTDEIKRFYFPGKIFIGAGVFNHAVDICHEAQGSVAVVIDSVLFERPAVKEALNKLKDKTVGTKVVKGAPIAQEAIEFAEQLGTPPGVVLVIGGGSATDLAKGVIAQFVFGTVGGIGIGGYIPEMKCPKPLLVSVPTTAGSGAEASRYYVTYDRHDHHKVYGKNWNLIADWILLEPSFLETMPEEVLVSCAFDAFVHLFETLICKHERSWFAEMFSLDGITHIMEALDRVVFKRERNNEIHARLMQAATLGGVAISNVRTGNIHEAAGALLELTGLSHPETLFVFFRTAIEQYKHAITDQETLLLAHLKVKEPFRGFNSLEDVIKWWESVFARLGLDTKIRKSVIECSFPVAEMRERIFDRVFSDKVWVTKENPIVLDEAAVWSMIDISLARFGADLAKKNL